MHLTSGHGSRGKASRISILKDYIYRQFSRDNYPCLDVYQELWPETLTKQPKVHDVLSASMAAGARK